MHLLYVSTFIKKFYLTNYKIKDNFNIIFLYKMRKKVQITKGISLKIQARGLMN